VQSPQDNFLSVSPAFRQRLQQHRCQRQFRIRRNAAEFCQRAIKTSREK
jgi:hypothetical protein